MVAWFQLASVKERADERPLVAAGGVDRDPGWGAV